MYYFQMDKGITFVLIWRKLGHCDKSLVKYIIDMFWIPAERELAILLRNTGRFSFFLNGSYKYDIDVCWWW